jgi:putative MATE family efflux protein
MAAETNPETAPVRPPFAGRMHGPPVMGVGGRHLIEGPIAPTLFFFSLPLLGTNALQSLSMTVNAIWVSHVLGPAALTATVNAQILMFLLMGAVMGVGMASNIVLAQSFGAGDMRSVKRVVGTATTFFVGSSVVLGAVGILATPAILDAMRTPPEARALAITYLRFTCLSMPVVFSFMFAMMMMRGGGDARTPFYYSLVSILLGFVFTPVLLTGFAGFPNWGIAGAAIGGFFAQLIALIAMVVHLYRAGSPLVLQGSDLRFLKPDLDILRVLITRGLPMGLQMLVLSGASIVLLSLVNAHGAVAAASYGAAQQLWSYVQMPAMAIGASVSSMAAQNIGAQRWDRVNKLALTAVLMGLAITGAVVVLLYALGDMPLRLFLPGGGPTLALAHDINIFVLWGWIPFAVTFVLFGIVRANGAILPPLLILGFALWAIRVPFAEFLQPSLGITAIWWSFPLGTIVSAALAFCYYRWGGWRTRTLMTASFARPSPPEPAAAIDVADAAPVASEPPLGTPSSPALGLDDLKREIEAMQRRHNLIA